MKVLYGILRAITTFNQRFGEWLSYLVLVMFVLLFLEVNLRYVFGSPTVWTMELTQMLFGAYAMFSGAYLMAYRGHVNVDIFYTRFPHRVRAGVDAMTSVLFFMFIIVLVTEGSSLAWDSLERFERSQSAWNPPVWPVKLTIPIASALLLLQGTVKLIEDILAVLGFQEPGEGAPNAPKESE